MTEESLQADSRYELTVIITTYNRPHLLELAVNSVTCQKVERVLIHIFDDHSTDHTETIVRGMMQKHSHIIYTRRKVNLGSLKNYEDALASVVTPYYLPLADDDWLVEGALEHLLDEIRKDNTLGAVIAQTLHQHEDNDHIIATNPDQTWDFRRYDPEELFPLWLDRGHFQWSSIIFRTSAKNAIGGPDISVDSVWDVDFQLRFFSSCPVKLLELPAAVYLLHSEQESRRISEQFVGGMIRMASKARSLGEEGASGQNLNNSLLRFRLKWIATAARISARPEHGISIVFCLGALNRSRLGFIEHRTFFVSYINELRAYLTAQVRLLAKSLKR